VIVSASRRTDIPAFYSEWLLNRLRAGFVLVQNPRNPGRYSRIALGPEIVDCIVFWTKNPAPMLGKLDLIREMGYPFYFQFTLTPYGQAIEGGLPPKAEILETFKKLSAMIGPERVVWRYDPVILGGALDVAYHRDRFGRLAAALDGYANRCVFSFVDFYPGGCSRALKKMAGREAGSEDIYRVAECFSEIAGKHRMRLSACSEPAQLSRYGISRASCIDKGMIEALVGCTIRAKKDRGQRPACGCVESIDIGAYGTCAHGCIYCYASYGPNAAKSVGHCHDPCSPALTGAPDRAAVISNRMVRSLKETQTVLDEKAGFMRI